MPFLDEVPTTFPDGRFLIPVKSDDLAEGALLAAVVAKWPPDRQADLAFSGDEAPMAALRDRVGARTLSKPRLKRCLFGYLVLGWAGYLPEACRNTIVYIPVKAAP